MHPGSGRLRLSQSSGLSGGPCAQSGGQARNCTDPLVRFRIKLSFSIQVYTGIQFTVTSSSHASNYAQLLSEANCISRLTR